MEVPEGIVVLDMEAAKQKQAKTFVDAINEFKGELGNVMHQNFQERLKQL